MHPINIFTASIYLMGKWGFSRYKFDGLYFIYVYPFFITISHTKYLSTFLRNDTYRV